MAISVLVVVARTMPVHRARKCHPSPGSALAKTLVTARNISFLIMTAAEKPPVDVVIVIAMKATSRSIDPNRAMTSIGALAQKVRFIIVQQL